MNMKTNVHSYGTYRYYRCATRRKMRKSACTNHTIRIDKLEQAVLVTIQKMIDTATETSELLNKINNSSKRKSESMHLQKALKTHTLEKEKLMSMITDLYPDWKSGIITQAEYQTLKEQFYQKLSVIEDKIKALTKSIEEFKNGITDENDFISHFKKYGNIEKLTRPLLTELVEEIFVYEGGDIEIVFKFQDAYTKAMEYIELNRSAIEDIEKQTKTA